MERRSDDLAAERVRADLLPLDPPIAQEAFRLREAVPAGDAPVPDVGVTDIANVIHLEARRAKPTAGLPGETRSADPPDESLAGATSHARDGRVEVVAA